MTLGIKGDFYLVPHSFHKNIPTMLHLIDVAIGSLGILFGLHAGGGHQGAYALILCRRYRDFVWACLLAGLLRSKLLCLLCVQQLARGQVALSLLFAILGAMDTIFLPPWSLLPALEGSLMVILMQMSSPEDSHRLRVFFRVVAGWPLSISAVMESDVLVPLFWIPHYLVPWLLEGKEPVVTALAVFTPPWLSPFEAMVEMQEGLWRIVRNASHEFWALAGEDLGRALPIF